MPEKRIAITHCVDPHRFYFKYVDDCVNKEYSKFDYAVQCYGNDLYDRQLSTHDPDINELIIFFDIISNKWLRGRVIEIIGDKITLWCIDNGKLRRTERQFIKPLTEDLKKDFNLVQLGGVTVLPAENTLDFDTLIVKVQVKHSWDDEMKKNFRAIVDSAKRVSFNEDMELDHHKFGTLSIETWKDKVVVVDDILLEMGRAIDCGGSAGMATYWFERRMKKEFHQSLEKLSVLPKSINSRRSSMASGRCDIDMITNPFQSETASDRTDLIQSKALPKSNGSKFEMEVQENPSKSRPIAGASGKSDVVERSSKPVNAEETSSKSDESKMDSVDTMKSATGQSIEKQPDVKAVKSKGASSTPDQSKVEMKNPFSPKRMSGACGISNGMEPARPTEGTTNKSESQIEETPIVSKKTSDAPVKCDWKPVKLDGAIRKSDKSMADPEQNPFKTSSGSKEPVSESLQPKGKPDKSDKTEVTMEENPFKRKKCPVASSKRDGIELHLEPVQGKEIGMTSDKAKFDMDENPFKPKKLSGSSGDGNQSQHLETVKYVKPSGTLKKSFGMEPDIWSVKSKEKTLKSNESKTESEPNPFKPKKKISCPQSNGIELHLEPVTPEPTTSVDKLKTDENPFKLKPKKQSGESDKSNEMEHVKRTTSLSKQRIDDNLFKLMGIQSDFKPAERESMLNTIEKMDNKLQSKHATPNAELSLRRKSDGDVREKTERSREIKKTDHSPHQNGIGSIESIDKTGIDSVRMNSTENETALSSMDGSIDTPDTISMAVSTIRSFINQAKVHRNVEKAKSRHIDYDCHLKTLKFGSGQILRRPLQTSMGWINEQRFPVDDDNESCTSSIINLMDD